MDDFTYIGGELDLFEKARRWKLYLRDSFQPFIGKRVLEVGAGTGGTTKILCDGSQQSWVCLEPDQRLAARLGPAIEARHLPACCSVRIGTVGDVATDPPFDTALYIDVLEHIEDDAGELRRVSRVIAPGGHVLALSPAHQKLYSPFDKSIGHCRRYSRGTFAAIAPEEFEAVKVIYLDSVGLLASLGNRAMLRQQMPTARQIKVWDRLMVPMSRVLDPILLHRLGKSVLAVWRRRG